MGNIRGYFYSRTLQGPLAASHDPSQEDSEACLAPSPLRRDPGNIVCLCVCPCVSVLMYVYACESVCV